MVLPVQSQIGDYSFNIVVKSGDVIAGKTLLSVNTPSFNDNGDVVFVGVFSGGKGIFTPTALLVEIGDTIDGKTLTELTRPSLNDSGEVAFRGTFSGGSGIFTLTSLLVENGDFIDGKTLNTICAFPSLNDNGNVAFCGSGVGFSSAIFSSFGGLEFDDNTTIDGKTATNPFRPKLNNNGDISFLSSITAGGNAVFTPTNAYGTGDTIAGKTLTGFNGEQSYNDNGSLVFGALFSGGSGIFTPTTLLVQTGDTIDGKTLNTVNGASGPSHNNNEDVVFKGTFTGGSGIFTLTELLLQNGDIVSGETISSFDDPLINDNDEIAVRINLSSTGSAIIVGARLTLDQFIMIGTPQPNEIFNTNMPTFVFSASDQNMFFNRILATVDNSITIVDQSFPGSFGTINFVVQSPVPLSEGQHLFSVLIEGKYANVMKEVDFSISTNPDIDNDGIFDNLDTMPLVFSDDFSDVPLGGGTTFGTILDRGNLLLTIFDVPNPDGVRITASAIDAFPGTATIETCSPPTPISATAGDDFKVFCGSTIITVLIGPVEAEFEAVDGTTAMVTVNDGDTVIYDSETSDIIAADTNVGQILIVINGEESILTAGEASSIDPVQSTQILIEDIKNLGLKKGDEKSLTVKLDNVVKKLSDKNQKNDLGSCDRLDEFIDQVNALEGSSLTMLQADELRDSVPPIKNGIGCDEASNTSLKLNQLMALVKAKIAQEKVYDAPPEKQDKQQAKVCKEIQKEINKLEYNGITIPAELQQLFDNHCIPP